MRQDDDSALQSQPTPAAIAASEMELNAFARVFADARSRTVRLGEMDRLSRQKYGKLPEDLAESALLDAATVHFGGERPVTLAEARASVRGGIAAGKRRPRDLGSAA